MKAHHYGATVAWTGVRQGTTSSLRAYSREYEARVEGKQALRLTADVAFLGDTALHNPEDFLMISLSGCHLLMYLAECARAGLRVLSYEDEASGVMTWDGETFRFDEVVLRPRVVIEDGGDPALAEEPHQRAHGLLLHRSLGDLRGAARARGEHRCSCDFLMARDHGKPDSTRWV